MERLHERLGPAAPAVIPVTPAAEPKGFDARVRQPGLSAIDELIGRPPRLRRRGPRRKAVARQPRHIPPGKFPPFWRETIPELRAAYEGRCAYLAMYLEPATGDSTVDHFIARSRDWTQVYEWGNYRLCAGVINGTKGEQVVLDPFTVGPGWFALEFVGFQVVPGPLAPSTRVDEIENTIIAVGLNAQECCAQREEYVRALEAGEVTLAYVRRRAPFIADELARQGRLGTPHSR